MTTETTQDHILELVNITRSFGSGETEVHALSDVSLSVDAGEMVAIMGTSGSGKSTLLNIAGGLDQPTSGRVLLGGVELGNLSAKKLAAKRRQSLGFIFQDYNLIASLTALENVSLPLELDGVRPRQARRLAQKALQTVDLTELAKRYPDELSGGQQQRVAIARAFVGDRSVLLADEPTGALDSVTGEMILELMRNQIDQGKAGLLVTHDARHAAWADRIIYLRDGKVIDESAVVGLATLLEQNDETPKAAGAR